MSCDGKCEVVQFKVETAHLVHIRPRPRPGAPPDLELQLSQAVRDELERKSHTCPDGCDCVIGEPVEVESREQFRKTAHDQYTAWFKVKIIKYRTPGECMPASDELPEGVRG